MRPGPFIIPGTALAAEQRRIAFWRTFGGECTSILLWLVVSAGLATALVLLARELSAMEAALVLAARV